MDIDLIAADLFTVFAGIVLLIGGLFVAAWIRVAEKGNGHQLVFLRYLAYAVALGGLGLMIWALG